MKWISPYCASLPLHIAVDGFNLMLPYLPTPTYPLPLLPAVKLSLLAAVATAISRRRHLRPATKCNEMGNCLVLDEYIIVCLYCEVC